MQTTDLIHDVYIYESHLNFLFNKIRNNCKPEGLLSVQGTTTSGGGGATGNIISVWIMMQRAADLVRIISSDVTLTMIY